MPQEEELNTLLAKSQLLFADVENIFFRKYHLGSTRYFMLVHLQNSPGLSLSQVSQLLLCTNGNTTRILRSMVNMGTVRRETDAGDNRAIRLYLTEKGEKLVSEANAAYRSFNNQRFNGLDSEEKETFQKLLEKLNGHLTAMKQER